MDITFRITYKDPKQSAFQLVRALRLLLKDATVTTIDDKRLAGYHRPVCPKCHVEFRPECNGTGVLDFADFGPYSIWDSDLWKCPECGNEVIGGFGNGPISAHYQEDFTKIVEGYKSRDLLVENQG